MGSVAGIYFVHLMYHEKNQVPKTDVLAIYESVESGRALDINSA